MHLHTLLAAGALTGAPLVLPSPSRQEDPAPPAGPGWADVDVDGRPDLLARGESGGVRLLINKGPDGFADETDLHGLGALANVRRVAWQDADGDGLVDLLAVVGAGSPRLLRNLGGHFQDVTAEAGLPASVGAVAEHWMDVDDDGRPDLLLVSPDRQLLLRNRGDLRFEVEELPAALTDTAAPLVAIPLAGESRERTTLTSSSGLAPDAAAHDARAAAAPRTAGGGFARRRTAPGRTGATDTSGGASGPGGPGGPSAEKVSCVASLADLAGGACLEASSIPQLGALFPMSVALNVAPSGAVGLGTDLALAPVHVRTEDVALPAGALLNDSLVVEGGDSILGLYSSFGGTWGSGLTLGQVTSGALVDKWSLARQTVAPGAGDGRLFLSYGSDPDHAANTPVAIFEPGGDVAIGLDTASGDRLNVYTADTDGAVARIQNGSSISKVDAMVVYHNGEGRAINASTSAGPHAIRASGPTGIYATGADYGVEAYSSTGSALHARNGGGSKSPAAIVSSESSNPTLYVTNLDPSDPKAASFGGDVAVGYPGFAGLTVARAHLGVDSSNAGFLQLLDDDGNTTILLDGDSGGEGRIVTDVLEITGGADLVESFDTREDSVAPGTVLVIDPTHPGELAVSREAYDRKVAGVVSGAGGVKPGLRMGQEGVASGETPVALTGRVYARASAENGAIRPGDRLTTASTPGHAMRVTDESRAGGAVIGKAMSALDEGTGLVLVLVNLQ